MRIQWSPNARGLLARPWKSTDSPSVRADTDIGLSVLYKKDDEVNRSIINVVEEIAKEKGVSMATISAAWCLAKGVNPIVGLNSKERIDEAVKAVKVVLSEEEINRLEAGYVPRDIIRF